MKDSEANLEEVRTQLSRIANFLFFSMPNEAEPNEPIMDGGRLIGVRVHEMLHRFEIHQRLTRSGLQVQNQVGQPEAQVHMTWRPIPDNFKASPDAEIPPTPLDPTRPQRFMMHDGRFTINGMPGTELRGFGTGTTLPVVIDGKPKLRLAAIVDVVEALGEFAGHSGMIVVNGHINPPDGLDLSILLRLTDGNEELLARTRLPRLRPIPPPDPEDLFLIFLGDSDPEDPIQIRVNPEGQMEGAVGPQRMRLVDVVFSTVSEKRAETRKIVSKTRLGHFMGRMDAMAWFDPFSGKPPFPFQTTDGVFTFYDRDGETLGTIHANMTEGRALPTEIPGTSQPVYRVGGIAPATSGTGCFEDVVGLFTVSSFISLVPNVLSGIFILQLSDAGHRLRKALAGGGR